jgi:hypothetical protein
LFHHCKEKNNNRSTTETRIKRKKRTTSKIGDTKRTKNMSTSLKNYIEREREREKEIKKEKVVVLLEEE